jgi:co-chaperonin GroES (HSP10)
MSKKNYGSPFGSGVLVRVFKDNGELKSGIFDPTKQGALVPCVEVLKVGPDVKQVKEGDWVLTTINSKPSPIVIGDELLYLIKEYDVMYVYAEKPSMEAVYATNIDPKRDLSPYVDVTPFKDLKAKFRDEEGNLVTLSGTPIKE